MNALLRLLNFIIFQNLPQFMGDNPLGSGHTFVTCHLKGSDEVRDSH